MEEISYLVSKSIAKVICFSTNEEMKLSCLKLLNVNNFLEAEKVFQQQLIEWKKQPMEKSYLKSQLTAQKRKVFPIVKFELCSHNLNSYFHRWIAS